MPHATRPAMHSTPTACEPQASPGRHELPSGQQLSYLKAKKQIGSHGSPLRFSFPERVFSEQDIPTDKLMAKKQVKESLQSRILASERPDWQQSTLIYPDPRTSIGKRTNATGERVRTNMYQYNYRAEILPHKYPSLKPRPNKFNDGLVQVQLANEDPGESFGCERMQKGISKRTEELPNHPALRDATPWNHSISSCQESYREKFAAFEAKRQQSSRDWTDHKLDKIKYRNPLQLAIQQEAQQREQKQVTREHLTNTDASSPRAFRF